MKNTFANLLRGAALAAVALTLPAVPTFAQYSSPIHDVDNAARQPVQFQLTVSGQDGMGNIGGTAYTVPPGKRLVIETVTGNISVPVPQFVEYHLGVTAGGMVLSHLIHVDPPIAFNGYNNIYTTVAARLYADPGTDVSLGVFRGPAIGTWTAKLTVSGYLVNLP